MHVHEWLTAERAFAVLSVWRCGFGPGITRPGHTRSDRHGNPRQVGLCSGRRFGVGGARGAVGLERVRAARLDPRNHPLDLDEGLDGSAYFDSRARVEDYASQHRDSHGQGFRVEVPAGMAEKKRYRTYGRFPERRRG